MAPIIFKLPTPRSPRSGGKGKRLRGQLGTPDNVRHTRYYPLHGRAAKPLSCPFARDVTISSEPSRGDKYRAGESIEVKVQFERNVIVDGKPVVELLVGAGDDSLVNASYDRGSGSNTLYFKYDVPAGAIDPDGITVKQGYADHEGTIHGLAADGEVTDEDDSHAVSPYHDALENQSDHKVDGRPYITGISLTSSPPNGVSYRYGDDIDIALQFDQTVSVQDLPYIPLWIGTADGGRQEDVKYASGSLTDTLTFRYDIEEDDVDTDGISVPERTGFIGTGKVLIPDTDRWVNDFILGLEVQSSHKVDGRLPFVESAAITSAPAQDETYRLGESIEVSLTFDKEVDVLGRPTIRLELGDSESRRDATYSSGEGTKTLVFAYAVLTTDVDSDGVALTERESHGIDGPSRVYEAGTEN